MSASLNVTRTFITAIYHLLPELNFKISEIELKQVSRRRPNQSMAEAKREQSKGKIIDSIELTF